MPDRISEGYTEALNAIAAGLQEIARAVAAVTATPPWIDAQAAAEQPQAASGGNRTGGGSWVPQTGAETLRAIEENAPRFVAALEAAGFVVSLAQPADPVDEHDHRWVEQDTTNEGEH